MNYRYYTVDVFTDTPFQGVPIAVFPEASGMSDDLMQQIANELHAPNTVFLVQDSDNHSYQIRVFTPLKETPYGNHTILAASHVLGSTNAIELKGQHTQIIFEGKGGKVESYLSHENGQPSTIQQSYQTHAAIDYYTPTTDELAAMLTLTPADIGFDNYRPLIVSCGTPYLIVPIKSYTAIRKARFNEAAWSSSSAPTSLAQEILLYANNTDDNPADFHARLLGPSIANHEDPPIGGVIAAFANHICAHEHIQQGTHTFAVQRGANEARKSLLYVEMDNKKTNDLTIRVGGTAVLMGEGLLEF